MSEPRDHERILRRWNWTGWGYEEGFPRGCQFTDVDAATEFNRRRLLIETKHFTASGGPFPRLDRGQELFYQNELRREGTTVLVLYGDAERNMPLGVHDLGRDETFDWRSLTTEDRRLRLKNHINRAMGLPLSSADDVGHSVPADECVCCGESVAVTVAGYAYCSECRPFVEEPSHV